MEQIPTLLKHNEVLNLQNKVDVLLVGNITNFKDFVKQIADHLKINGSSDMSYPIAEAFSQLKVSSDMTV